MAADKLIALVDLDGTLADYSARMVERCNHIRSPGEPEITPSAFSSAPEWLKRRIRMVKTTPGFWSDLPRIEDGFFVVDLLRKRGFQIHILTKGPRKNSIAWSEKVVWCDRNGLDFPITVATDKSLVYGKLLFDDWPEYVAPWLQHRPRGHVLMLDQPWNRDFSHERVIRVPREDRTKIIEAVDRASYIAFSTGPIE